MGKNSLILLIIFLAGLVILLLPDNSEPVITFNKKHGPSIMDLLGLVLMLISWFLSCVVVVRNWKEVKSKTGNSNFRLLIVVYIISIAGVALSLILSSDLSLWPCVAVASFINVLFIIYAFLKE